MSMERTFAIIKPGAVAAGHAGNIISMIERSKFTIVAMEKTSMTTAQAQELYQEHKERSFFGEMVSSMTSSPIIVMVLERENAVAAWRELMGATNPAQATLGTIRSLYGENIGNNAVHGSDSLQSSARERGIFFPGL